MCIMLFSRRNAYKNSLISPSPPTRGRELKLIWLGIEIIKDESPPTRGRELKLKKFALQLYA